MELSSIVLCGPGKIRAQNQDNYYLNGRYREQDSNEVEQWEEDYASLPALYAVADGMGGERHGEIASLIAVRGMDEIDRTAGETDLNRYLLDRNDEICRLIEENHGERSGTTFAGLCVCNTQVTIANIGDSRVYLYRNNELKQLSVDHTSLRQMVEMGVLSQEAARIHPDLHVLSQHLGIFPNELIIEPYFAAETLQSGDIFLLCSDGLYDMVNDTSIQAVLAEQMGLRRRATMLFDAAMSAGGRDNITVLLVEAK